MDRQYTNEIIPERLAKMDQSPFTAEQLAEMGEGARALIEERKAYCLRYPVTAIYRPAVAGCLTRQDGVGNEHNPAPEEGHKIRLENGQWARGLTEGGIITYPGGSTAKIISSVRRQYSVEDKGIALVGRLLDNGDEIISTPQASSVLTGREGVGMPSDFLSIVEGA